MSLLYIINYLWSSIGGFIFLYELWDKNLYDLHYTYYLMLSFIIVASYVNGRRYLKRNGY